MVTRDDRVLLVKQRLFGRSFYIIPGGGVEPGETSAEAALRELYEECCVVGYDAGELNVTCRNDGRLEYVFHVKIPEDAVPCVGRDPELSDEEQIILDVEWKRLDELSEKDRAFLCSYGILQLEPFRSIVLDWGEAVSYPHE